MCVEGGWEKMAPTKQKNGNATGNGNNNNNINNINNNINGTTSSKKQKIKKPKTRDSDCCSINFIKYVLMIFNIIFFVSAIFILYFFIYLLLKTCMTTNRPKANSKEQMLPEFLNNGFRLLGSNGAPKC